MKKSKKEKNKVSKRDKFLNKIKREGTSANLVMFALWDRRSWQEGMTSDQIVRIVRKAKKKKGGQFSKKSLYTITGQINRYRVPGIHLSNKPGFIKSEKGNKVEWRYWNIATEKDADQRKTHYEKLVLSSSTKYHNLEMHMAEELIHEKVMEPMERIEVHE